MLTERQQNDQAAHIKKTIHEKLQLDIFVRDVLSSMR